MRNVGIARFHQALTMLKPAERLACPTGPEPAQGSGYRIARQLRTLDVAPAIPVNSPGSSPARGRATRNSGSTASPPPLVGKAPSLYASPAWSAPSRPADSTALPRAWRTCPARSWSCLSARFPAAADAETDVFRMRGSSVVIDPLATGSDLSIHVWMDRN